MRFISSLTLLSLAGLGLASPVGSPDEVTDAASGPLAGLTGMLGMRNAHKDRRQTGSVGASGNTASVDGEASKSPFDVVPGLHPRGEGEGKGDGKGKGKGKGKCNDTRHTACLRPDDVNILVDAYTRMLSKWNDADAKYLADSFVDRSDSINILAGIPLGSPTFPTKQAFIDHEHTQPDNLPLVITHKSPVSCDEITLIWQATFGAAQKQVRGLSILGATKDKGYWQIKSIDVEFNSLAYLLDIGGTFKMPGQP